MSWTLRPRSSICTLLAEIMAAGRVHDCQLEPGISILHPDVAHCWKCDGDKCLSPNVPSDGCRSGVIYKAVPYGQVRTSPTRERDEPDPREAFAETVAWLWEHRSELPPLRQP